MHANPYMAADPRHQAIRRDAGWYEQIYAPAGRGLSVTVVRPKAPVRPLVRPATGVRGVRDLIAAAGPLTVVDIAGGLDVPVRRAAAYVRWMERNGHVNADEWDRFRLAA